MALCCSAEPCQPLKFMCPCGVLKVRALLALRLSIAVRCNRDYITRGFRSVQIALIRRRVAVWLARFELAISSVRGKQGGQAPPQPVSCVLRPYLYLLASSDAVGE